MQLLVNKSFVALAAVLALAKATGAYFCNGANWTDDCAHWTDLTNYGCYTLDAGHQNSISSFGPDSGVTCELYTDYLCGDACIVLSYPGASTLNLDDGFNGQDCNDRVNSFKCWQ
ncbi:hypothetical protein C8R45DRAFT_1109239 [Mycena sanguinolenta]|nr:hypothetical protein C8R45DRAFT_1109239 [Mycena sanguinolenta]